MYADNKKNRRDEQIWIVGVTESYEPPNIV